MTLRELETANRYSEGMDATPVDFLMHQAAVTVGDGDSRSALALDWTALHAAAEVAASLAGIRADAMPAAAQAFAPAVERAGGWRLDLARQGIDDIAAMLEPGLAALLAIHAQGGDPQPPALALWQEFDRARQALLAIARSAQDICQNV